MKKEKRSALVQVMMTPCERVALEKLANIERMTLSEYVRFLLRQTAKDANVWLTEVKNESRPNL